MQSVMIQEFGGPEVLRFVETDKPGPGPNDVLIRVKAAGVNPVDWKSREGEYAGLSEDQLPAVPGRDMAGVIEDVGTDVTDWQEGDEVFAFLGPGLGGYQHYVVLGAGDVAAKPASLTMTESGAVPLAAMTAWQGLFDHGGLTPGQRVLILGGAGGVGHLAIQFAKARGATVASTAAADDLDFLRGLGCDEPLAYDAASPLDGVDPVDVVLDLIGGDGREKAFAAVKPEGMVVSVLGEPEARGNVRTAGFMTRPDAAQLAEIAELFDDGKARLEVQRVLPFADAAEAQERLRRDHSRGKTVLDLS